MKPEKLIEVLSVAERLKDAVRHCYTSGGRRESVAEHSWRITLMAYFVSDEFPDADLLKIMKMCLIHDLGEAFTGDIPAFEKTDKDSEKEADVLGEWVKTLPEPFDKEMAELYQEMEAQQTLESRIYKALDKLEALIQHNESDIKTWIPLEYDLQMTYGDEQVKFSDYLTELRAQVSRPANAFPCLASSLAISCTVSWIASRLAAFARLARSNLPAVAPFSASTRI